ncbi:PREDICTED: dynein assembly factor 5, axonemal-like [Thamnophis sirtalis]|uniref:Dynein assembly factor 5, axonemal-like n=1 Tax=Thamnophis sirtalis TaxID=35019 RepID=A0A6I9YST7_9SAUR|nr:PREDICTED: dynein assembly factor 5, axonemal-like [Thamnophis sirtalis]
MTAKQSKTGREIPFPPSGKHGITASFWCFWQVFYLEQLLCCVENLVELCQEDCKEISLQLTKVLVTIMAIPTAGHLYVKLEEAMSALAEVQHIRDATGLYKQHISQLMEWLSSTHHGWSSCSPELLQLDVVATQSGPLIAEVLKDFISILKTCLHTSKDPRMRLKLFSILSQLLQSPGETVNSKG